MKFNEAEMSPKVGREFDNLKADKLVQDSKIDLLALMTDTEFPEDEMAEGMEGMSGERA